MPYQAYLVPALIVALIAACGIAFFAISRLSRTHQEQKRLVEERTVAVTERAEALRQLEILRSERNAIQQELLQAERRVAESTKGRELTEQRMQDIQLRMQDWEKQKEEAIQASRASILKAGGEMSTKLLEDHKREMETAKKQAEELTKKTTEDLFKQFSEVTQSVAALKDVSHTNRTQMDLVMRALTNPSGAGRMAEIGLENSLKNLGLEPGRDYIMQYHIAGDEGSARPDTVIFLPQNMVIVVDAKASKFLLELAEVEGTDAEELTLARLKQTMNTHLSKLASRDYAGAIAQSYKKSGREGALGHIFNVMYLPSEAAIEKLRRADPEFDEKTERHSIILAGPTSLAGLFSLAKSQIAAGRQNENSQRIIEAAEGLMESVIMALTHVDRVGSSIRSAADAFDKFGKSINRFVIPRLKTMHKLGATPAKQKEIPAPLATYDIRKIEETIDIEVDMNEEKQKLINA